MKTKKIFAAALAGLCAVSTMGVSAFAADNETKVEAAGEKSYKITAGFQAPTMDVTVPTEIKGVINPYMIEVEIDGVKAVAEGVASPRYAITNNSAEVGVKVNATYSADGLDGIVDAADKATDPAKNTKGQKLAYVTLNAALGTDADAETTLVMAATEKTTTDPILELTENGGANDAGEIWLGGAVPETPADKWTAKDKLTINVVLDLVPYNTGAGGNGGGGGGSFTAAVDAADISFTGTAATLGSLTANNTYALAYDGGVGGNVTPAFAGYSITSVTGATTGITVNAAGRFSCSADGTYTLAYELENDSDSSDTPTITFVITASDC